MMESKSQNLKEFFLKDLPDAFGEYINEPFIAYDQKDIIKQIDFHPPFLRTEKIAIFKNNSGIVNYRSLGMGTIFPKDTNGHYNSTIYLAMCGWLMASTSSVHLAYNYPNTAPQVVEADKVKPLKSLEGENILKPRLIGTTFWVETVIRKTKMKFVLATARIGFGNILYGTIEDLKFIITPKESIWAAKEVQEK